MDKSLLARALADSEEPTPGYMYRDIVKWTYGDQTTQTKLIKALMDRLKPNATTHVLTKTLKMVKHLCENGHLDFQKEMQGKSETLKQFANYRGSQDAKYGDKLNERVRASAKEAVDSAFAPRKAGAINIDSGHGSNTGTHDSKTESKGGSGFTTGNTVNTTSGKTGDGRIADMPTGNKWAEHMAKGGGVVQEDPGQGFGGSIKTGFQTGFGLVKEKVQTKEQLFNEKLNNTGEYQAVDIAPTFGGGGGGFGLKESSGGSEGWKFTDEQAGGGNAPATQEVRMVTPMQKEVQKFGAFKNTPQRVEVSNFCETVAKIVAESEGGHTYEDLAEAMDASISQKHPWQVRLNVLCCLEGVARSKVSPEFNNYFIENPEDIQRNMHVVQGSLKEKAQKILKLLGIAERTVGAGTTVAQQISSCTSQGETTWAGPAVAKETETAPGGEELDFGGMAETAPRRKKGEKGGKAEKTSLKKRTVMATAQEETTTGGWDSPPASSGGNGGNDGWGASSGGGGDGWGSTQQTTTTSAPAGDGWGSAPATTSGADSWGASPAQAQAPAPVQAPPAPAVHDMDAFFGVQPTLTQPNTAPPITAPVPQQPAWGPTAPAPAPAKQPVWGGADMAIAPAPTNTPPVQASNSSFDGFDPMSLPAPTPAPAPAPTAQPAGGDNAQAMQQMMTSLNQQMQALMVNASSNPNAQQQMQMLMQQQQQLIQMMQQGGGGMPTQQPPAQATAPSPQQQYQQQQVAQKKADDDFAFAAQQMRQQMPHK